MSVLGWGIFVLAVAISLATHEAGHFLTAKAFRIKATRFFIGIGPTVWSMRRGETEYGIKAIPFGAFVKVVGMTSLDEDVDPADEPRSMRRHPRWQRAIVMAGGSIMQFGLAFVLLAGLAMGIGLQNGNTARLGAIGRCVPASTKALDHGTCSAHAAASPAEQAGLRAGDQVVAFDGRAVTTWTQLSRDIQRVPAGRAATIQVVRDGQRLTLHPVLAAVAGRPGGYLGVSPTTVFQTVGPVGAAQYAGRTFGSVLAGSARVVESIPAAIPSLFSPNRAHTAAGQIGSLVGAGEATNSVVTAHLGWQLKTAYVLLIIASLNIFLGAFNLLPLLPLDGGHLAVIGYERLRAWLARLRGRTDPGLADLTRLIPVSLAVFGILVLFSLVLVVADIVNPVATHL
jgi:membrane-associated protease RseP (regulator of RpoE activity)